MIDNGEALLAARWRDTVLFSSPWTFCALASQLVRPTCSTPAEVSDAHEAIPCPSRSRSVCHVQTSQFFTLPHQNSAGAIACEKASAFGDFMTFMLTLLRSMTIRNVVMTPINSDLWAVRVLNKIFDRRGPGCLLARGATSAFGRGR